MLDSVIPAQKENTVWDYTRLYQRVKEYVLEDFPIFDYAPNLFSSLSRSTNNTLKVQDEIQRHELLWLQYNLPFLKQVVHNRVASLLVYCTCRNMGKLSRPSFFPRKIAEATGHPEQTIGRWARKIRVKELFKVHTDPMFKRTYYFFNLQYPTINRLLVDLIRANYSVKEFEADLQYTLEKRKLLEQRKRAVRMCRRNNYKKGTYYKSR